MKNVKIFSLGITMFLVFLSFKTVPYLQSTKNPEKTITGIVSDELGPISGANVNVLGTLNSTITDFDGKYSIKAKEGDILEFSYIGMKETRKVGKANVINVQLKAAALEEVVVVGATGIKRKNEETTTSYSVTNNRVVFDESAPPLNQNYSPQTISGKVAGLNINSTNNEKIIIRGNRSIIDENKALIIVDGKISTTEKFQKITPNDIESVDVVKGAQGAVLYGEQGANGLIVAFTKNGLTQKEKEDFKKLIKPDTIPVDTSDEDYEIFLENEFESPKQSPLSTFSIDVDNASYTNIRRFLNYGQEVPKDAVRVEEMINFFKYDYAQPKGNHPFAIETEYSDCPWNENHRLLKIGLQGKEIPTQNLPHSNFVFLIDVSGSMSSPNKLPLLKEAMKILVNQLREKDKVAIVVYAGAAGLVLPPTSGTKKETILNALDQLQAGGSTAGGAGIQLAYKIAQENFIKGGNNRIILATDGDFNVGASSDNDMERLIEEKRKSGVFLTCLGFGMGNYKDSKMEILADKGNGNYAYIDNIQEANRFLGKEFKGSMFAIAKDVKIQIEFNPKHVQSYRLIGYENRKLRPEDFKNDAIDAGELGSGHTVTALYEIIPVGVQSDFFQKTDELKYSNVTNNQNYSDELATIKFRYKKPDGEKSIEIVQTIKDQSVALAQSSEDFKFSTAVAWFGLKLRDSKLIHKKSNADIKVLAKQGKSKDTEGYRAEFIRLVDALN
ncbi:VWA domain-containing protein [Flavobacterium sediminis]|uniref:VWA domain-containing protein n=1 Tax=Flavobacterium sediminis TaxID=2201181 RepID=A0A2U8QWY6_9FLAO|nr:VWA domain-containing protein [Flavobacterium sediminis]AWM14394.1 VWA domain-containing protein [Flavobacterium sediminis]